MRRAKQVVANEAPAPVPAVPIRNTKAERPFEVRCPHCQATRDFLTPDGVVMIRVLEDETDVELLEEGTMLFCEACGGAFKCPPNPIASR